MGKTLKTILRFPEEQWLLERRGVIEWHSDGTCYIDFASEPDGLRLQVHGATLAAAVTEAKLLEGRRALKREA